jgi:hypothetical protein
VAEVRLAVPSDPFYCRAGFGPATSLLLNPLCRRGPAPTLRLAAPVDNRSEVELRPAELVGPRQRS